MADHSKIEWTDATWNIITGCDIVSPGCTNCYAMQLAGTRLRNHPSRQGLTRPSKHGKQVWTGEVRFNEEWLTQPLRWRRPRRIFVAAHGDLFHESVADEWLDKIFAVMQRASQHTFQVLTKRPKRMRAYITSLLAEADGNNREWFRRGFVWPLSALLSNAEPYTPFGNVWLGVSVEDQKRADERIPALLDTPAALRWISAEPLLGPIDLLPFINRLDRDAAGLSDDPLAAVLLGGAMLDQDRYRGASAPTLRGLDWVVAGGESGSHARPMHPDWARSLRDQCAAAGVAFHFKQWGAWGPDLGPEPDGSDPIAEGSVRAALWDGDHWDQHADAHAVPLHLVKRADDVVYRLGKKRTGRTLDGDIHDAWPEVA